jgi:uncharacterized protein
MTQPVPSPLQQNDRADILDILRGIALLGICIANYPMFSLYIFQPPDVLQAMPTAKADMGVGFFHFAFVDGKFYSLFSLLFGIGFSVILHRSLQAGRNGLAIFYRRVIILICIGLAHLLLLWEGDILMLYGLIGLILPLFRNVSDRNLLICFVCLILFPLVMDTLKVVSDNKINLSKGLERMAMASDSVKGISPQNFNTWVIDHPRYSDLLQYNQSGILWRYQMLLNNNRIFKVLGMFLLGLWVGRKMIYLKLEENKALLKKVRNFGFLLGLPVTVLYAWSEFSGPRIPDPRGLINTAAYALSVVPLSLAYTATIGLAYLRNPSNRFLNAFKAPGRMAMTNYIFQTICGILIFYGIGLGWGATTGAIYVVLIAIGVYLVEMILSHIWLSQFRYGPLEWIWRMLTYGKYLPIKKDIAQQTES